jgi:hypothetical protein
MSGFDVESKVIDGQPVPVSLGQVSDFDPIPSSGHLAPHQNLPISGRTVPQLMVKSSDRVRDLLPGLPPASIGG